MNYWLLGNNFSSPGWKGFLHFSSDHFPVCPRHITKKFNSRSFQACVRLSNGMRGVIITFWPLRFLYGSSRTCFSLWVVLQGINSLFSTSQFSQLGAVHGKLICQTSLPVREPCSLKQECFDTSLGFLATAVKFVFDNSLHQGLKNVWFRFWIRNEWGSIIFVCSIASVKFQLWIIRKLGHRRTDGPWCSWAWRIRRGQKICVNRPGRHWRWIRWKQRLNYRMIERSLITLGTLNLDYFNCPLFLEFLHFCTHKLKSEGIVEVALSLYPLNHFIKRSVETAFKQQTLGVFSIQHNP